MGGSESKVTKKLDIATLKKLEKDKANAVIIVLDVPDAAYAYSYVPDKAVFYADPKDLCACPLGDVCEYKKEQQNPTGQTM